MRVHFMALAGVLASFACASPAQTVAGAPLTLAEALRRAEIASPAVRAREAQMAAAEGTRREAQALLYNNPEFGVEGTRRKFTSPDGRANEWNAGVAQPFEIGGQQARRREAAAAGLEAVRSEIDQARLQAGAQAALRFHAVLAAQRRIGIEQRSLVLFDGTAEAIARRRAAGEDTRLDANVARIESERAHNALAVAREQLLDARADLAEALQLPPEALPEVDGELALPSAEGSPYKLDDLLASVAAQPRLRALAAREDAAKARLGLERAARYPDLKFGVFVGREGAGDARENITTLTLSVPLPLFKQNDAAIGQALSDSGQVEVERAAVARDLQAQVRKLWLKLQSQRERVLRLQASMLSVAIDNRQLSARSRQAGQIGLLDQLVVDRQSLDAERDLNDALAEYHATRIELEQAAGLPQEGNTR